MTTLASLGVNPQKEKQFHSKGIRNGEEMVRFFPRKYNDYRNITGVLPEDKVSVVVVKINKVEYKISTKSEFIRMTTTLVCDDGSANNGVTLMVFWFNQLHLKNELQNLTNHEILLIGKIKYEHDRNQFVMTQPLNYDKDVTGALRIYPVYSKISGMSKAYLEEKLHTALQVPSCTKETISPWIAAENSLMPIPDAIKSLHFPESMEDIERAKERVKFDDLLYFALRLELANRNLPSTSRYGISDTSYWDKLRESLPFSLTGDQQNAIDGMIKHINSGKRLNALLQGDVGSGKTIVAFALAALIASSGCQTAIVAPTRQFASQHYDDMVALLEPIGLKVAFYGDSSMRKTERERILYGLQCGEIQIVVGTHALFSQNVIFNRLGLVVIDEEHKFGVAQRKCLTDKAVEGVHCVTMSATPIPRSLAAGLYGDGIQVFSILTLPSGRLPTKTVAIPKSQKERLNSFVRYQYQTGHQTYVVCPAIEKGESATMENVIDITKAQQWLASLEAEGIKTEVLTGKTPKKESAEILERFKKNSTNVLLSTSVIEVGINIPSATGILILSAERFGLASLHQLRGRVGRGSNQGYCVLYGEEITTNERASVLCHTTNGFEIAEADLKIRGAGDFLGVQQSGDNKYVLLMLANQELFQHIKKIARKSIESGESYPLLEQAVADFRANDTI